MIRLFSSRRHPIALFAFLAAVASGTFTPADAQTASQNNLQNVSLGAAGMPPRANASAPPSNTGKPSAAAMPAFPDAPNLSSAAGSSAAEPSGPPSAVNQLSYAPPGSPRQQPAVADGLAVSYIKSAASIRNLFDAALVSGLPNLPSPPAQPQAPSLLNSTTGQAYETSMSNYGDAIDNWRRGSEVELRYRGRRAAVGLATSETRDFLGNLALPLVLREDPRYAPADLNTSFGDRMGHAFTSVFITHTRGGSTVPNFAKLGGTFGAAFVGEYVYADQFNTPELHTRKFLLNYAGFSLLGDMATNVSRELVRSAIKQDLLRIGSEGEANENNYYPLTVAGRAAVWARSTYSPRNFLSAALLAGIPKVTSPPNYPVAPAIDNRAEELAYDQTLIGYGNQVQTWRRTTEEGLRYDARRAIGGFSESETQGFLTEFLLPTALGQEGRYIPRGTGSFGSRIGHAVSSLAITRTNSGTRVPNLSLLAGTPGAAYIAQQVYYPMLGVNELATNSVLGKTIALNFGGDLLLNLVHEFRPAHTF